MYMRYHWLTDRVRQNQFDVYWCPGRKNLGHYHTKHHSVQHHEDIPGLILHQATNLHVLKWCVKLLPLPLPHPRPRVSTYAYTFQHTQRATHLRGALVRAYCVTVQNMNTAVLRLSHNFSYDMINITYLNEVH
jgi:hypothetical protein